MIVAGQHEPRRSGTPREVFGAFLSLGLSAFGGPIAHIGYFRTAFVIRRRWIDDAGFAELLGLCQLLPGPASSQLGFLLGLVRAGPAGAFAAWAAFTLPSLVLMLLLSVFAAALHGPVGDAALHGLKLVAVVMVAQAVLGMAQRLVPDRRRAAIAGLAAALVALSGNAAGQIMAIAAGAVAGTLLCRDSPLPTAGDMPVRVSRRFGWCCLALFAGLLAGLPLLSATLAADSIRRFDIFYRAGALVFGGGHVVLPLLQAELVPEWMTDARFLVGYGAAQALPGPLFAVAADLGAVAGDGIGSGVGAVVAIFLPGLLICVGILPFWAQLRADVRVRAGVMGANAAVVGVLGWALYDPLWTTAVASWSDIVMLAVGLAALLRWQAPPLAVVAGLVAANIAINAL
jgi:chromate transporter